MRGWLEASETQPQMNTDKDRRTQMDADGHGLDWSMEGAQTGVSAPLTARGQRRRRQFEI